MFDRRIRSVSCAIFSVMLMMAGASASATSLDYIGTFVWTDPHESFGGFSGIDISADGQSFHALTDRSHLYWGQFSRDSQGRIRGVDIRAHLKDSKGTPLKPGYLGDSEGLAVDAEGTAWVSFEGLDRIAGYPDPDEAAVLHPHPPQVPGMRVNSGLEALAIRDDGTIFGIPERSGGPDKPFPILTYKEGTWSQMGEVRRDPRWLMVGADFGPDGWLYLLERDFKGLLGFSARVRRIRFDQDSVAEDQILLETRSLQYDNLEGISVWDDGQGIRITMISDDNFLILQRTEIVEYRLRE